jgi:ATP-dependent exoDNAse (exonuclease V) beta subunit
LRNEAKFVGPIALQELLAEDLSGMLVTLLRLFTSERAGAYWSSSLKLICSMRGLSNDDERGRARIVRELNDFEAAFKAGHAAPVKSEKDAEAVISSLIELIGRRNLLADCPAYRQGDWLEKVMKSAGMHLHRSSRGTTSWAEAIDVFEGLHAVPLMTIHKSKGLEYHTVIFVGLDDGAWWSFKKDEYEATAGFFVAFTRAKQRVMFCYSPTRGDRSNVAPLYDLLKAAGVKTVAVA